MNIKQLLLVLCALFQASFCCSSAEKSPSYTKDLASLAALLSIPEGGDPCTNITQQNLMIKLASNLTRSSAYSSRIISNNANPTDPYTPTFYYFTSSNPFLAPEVDHAFDATSLKTLKAAITSAESIAPSAQFATNTTLSHDAYNVTIDGSIICTVRMPYINRKTTRFSPTTLHGWRKVAASATTKNPFSGHDLLASVANHTSGKGVNDKIVTLTIIPRSDITKFGLSEIFEL